MLVSDKLFGENCKGTRAVEVEDAYPPSETKAACTCLLPFAYRLGERV